MWPICDFTREPRLPGLRIGAWHPAREESLTDLYEPLELLDSYPDELPPAPASGDVNRVSLLSMADDLAKGVSALHVRAKCSDPEVAVMQLRPAQLHSQSISQILPAGSPSGDGQQPGSARRAPPHCSAGAFDRPAGPGAETTECAAHQWFRSLGSLWPGHI